MTSAAFHINAQASLLKHQTTGGGSGTATLDNTIGVTSSEWSFVGSDEGQGVEDWVITSQTLTGCTWEAPVATDASAILQCRINGGGTYDARSGRVLDGGDLVKTAKIYIGTEVLATNETMESNAINGWVAVVNPLLRAVKADGTGIGFFGHATAGQVADISALADNSAGTANKVIQAMPNPADTPASADALRDDIVANLLPALRNNIADLTAQVNALRDALRAHGLMA